MKDSWRNYFRRIAAACLLSVSAAWSSAVCYAVQLAYDSPDDPIYASSWAHGQNGGFGFTPWNFYGTSLTIGTTTKYDNPFGSENWVSSGQQAIDNGTKSGTTGSAQFNNIGRAWTLFNPNGPAVGATSANPPDGGTDIARVGRGFNFGSGRLEPGQTLTMVIDNPIEQRFYRGWTIKLNHGNANQCYSGYNCSTWATAGEITPRMAIGMFDFFSYGQWYATNSTPTLTDADTDAGMRIDFTLTGPDTFNLTMTPLDNSGIAYTKTGGTLSGAAGSTIDWLQIEFYNSDSDFYPSAVPGGPVPADYNNNGTVDAGDYVAWRKGGSLENEVVDTGTISPGDYTEWRARYGNSSIGDVRSTDFYIRSIEIKTAASGSGLEGGSVPEPSTFVLMAAATGVVTLGVRSRK
jgi:hypothetical protein